MSIDGFDIARSLVCEGFPGARAAWPGGSTVLGMATPTSDLDISVLLDGPPAPYRQSLRYHGWPVELFVHTDEAMQHSLAKDRKARRPATLRLIGRSLALLDNDGSGEYLRESVRHSWPRARSPRRNYGRLATGSPTGSTISWAARTTTNDS
ncbi:nucleotidyltransferase domain-containing protein [Nocardia testacea]|uniref:nucleotidyltransferase domain-containing protein n=1 Tax=Nocardia testacea TaxID=248551 RepID=UPI0002D77E3B|nr:nucleotidyltransferase domain-containing protein [Nocardia testacea]